MRCVRVVHGKGMGSPGKSPVLKGRVQSWLVQKKEVLAFVQARPIDGGAGDDSRRSADPESAAAVAAAAGPASPAENAASDSAATGKVAA